MTTQSNIYDGTDIKKDDARVVLSHLVLSGVTPSQALDVYMTVNAGMSAGVWADLRGVTRRAVRSNVERAAEILEEGDA